MMAMFQTSILLSTDFADCTWPEAELAQFESYLAAQPSWPPSAHENGPGIGHATIADPDRNYRIGFRIPEYVSRQKVTAFERVLQEQGAYPNRLAALDQAAYRVRAAKSVTARAYRVYDAVLDTSRGEHRCCLLDLDKIAYLAGVSDRSVASKVIAELEEGRHAATLKFTEGPLGSPTARRLFVAPIVVAEDRALTTRGRIHGAADEAKNETLRKRAEDARNRRARDGDPSERDHIVRSCHGVNDGVVDVASTTRVVDKSPKRSGRGGNSVNHNKDTTEERSASAPPSTDAGSPPPNSGIPAEGQRSATDVDVRAARERYNELAAQYGFTPISDAGFTAQRRALIRSRLNDIGGLTSFERALSAVPSDDFMMGRVPAREGRKPFRLDIDYLLLTRGAGGDVLGRLLDRAGDAESLCGSPRQTSSVLAPYWWRDNPRAAAAIGLDGWRLQLRSRPSGPWPVAMLGPPPGAKGCQVPPGIVEEFRLTEFYTSEGSPR
jgi:hypothetical protein